MPGRGEAVGVREADRMSAAKSCGLDPDRLSWPVDRDAKIADRRARSLQALPIGGWSDQYLGEVDQADKQGRVLFAPSGEQRTRLGMVGVGAVERTD